MVRWILSRERELRQSLQAEILREQKISEQWRTAHDSRAATDERRDRLMWQMLDTQQRILSRVEQLQAAIASMGGGPGSPDYGGTRIRPSPRHETP